MVPALVGDPTNEPSTRADRLEANTVSSWWRKIAVQQGATAGRGSWKRRVALSLVIPSDHGSWPRIIATAGSGSVKQVKGSWTRRLTPAAQQGSSWSRNLFNAGGPTA